MSNLLPTALAIPLLALAGAAHSEADQTAVHRAVHPVAAPHARLVAAPHARPVAAPHAHAVTAQAHRLDLSPPNFLSPLWQQRLQGTTIDHTFDYVPMESVIVTPGENAPNVTVAPAGLGSIYWAIMHPTQAWRIVMPTQAGDEFNSDREIALAYNDPQSDCPGFPGTPNVRPICP